MDCQTLKEMDARYIAGTYKRSDLCLERGEGATGYTFEGREVIDFSSGIGVNSLGYSEPGWVAAITRQAVKLQHTSNLYYTQPAVELAELLIEKTGMSKVFFANSGAEANEGAIKTARKYSSDKYGEGRHGILSLLHSFHGRTMTTITATGQEQYHKHFHPFAQGFVYGEAGNMEDIKPKLTKNICAVLIELIQGEGGVNTLDKAFVQNLAAICKEKDILLIVDEVQTGIGRTGTFFAYQQYGIQPDLVTSAKGLGGGLPIGAILFSEKTQGVLGYGDHGTTFGGNPVVCAGGAYIVKTMDEEFLSQVTAKGHRIREALKGVPGIKEVSGLGMMLGFLHETRTASEIAEACLKEGLIVLTAKDKVRLLPPLNITGNELEKGLSILKKVLIQQ